MVNFIFLAATTEAGSASIEGGKYVLTEHGKLVRELTEPEYTDFRAKQVRAFSGHWLVFYFVPFAYFMFRARAALPDKALGFMNSIDRISCRNCYERPRHQYDRSRGTSTKSRLVTPCANVI
jgi:hypothetical protein